MAFQYRACVTTDTGNAVPFTRPSGYDRTRYALLQGVLTALVEQGAYPHGPPASYFGLGGAYSDAVAGAGRHKAAVCCGAAAVMSDEPGLNAGWAHANASGRAAMAGAHRDYLAGMLFFLSTDAAVPEGTRASVSALGLCGDEWADAEPPHWPPQLYVRVSNRLLGDFVLTQHSMSPQAKPAVSVSCAVWEVDAHVTSRWAVANPHPAPHAPPLIPRNEGYLLHAFNVSVPVSKTCGSGADDGCTPDGLWFDVPFAVMLPKRTQASNLLVPVAISASAVAYSAARIETMFMDLGAAAGVAARMVVDGADGG